MNDRIRKSFLVFVWFVLIITTGNVTEFHLADLVKIGTGNTYKEQRAPRLNRRTHDFWQQMDVFVTVGLKFNTINDLHKTKCT